MGAVPDTNTFSLQDVLNIVATSFQTLDDAVYEAGNTFPQGCWDPAYSGTKDSLYNFRNYDNAYDPIWESFLIVVLGYISGSEIDLYIENLSQNRTISATVYWEAILSGNPVDSGSVSVNSLSGYDSIDLVDTWGQSTYDYIQAKVDSGPWVQIDP